MLLRRATRSLLLSTAALLLPVFAGAQGFGLNEIGSCAISRGFAVTAGGCSDASLIYWNPAATVRLDGWSLLAGASSIALKGTFTRDTTGKEYEMNPPVTIVPNVFLNHHMKGSKLSLGAGVYVPYGLTSEWSDSFPGRFASRKASLKTIYVQPNVAYQITSKWSIGGGPIWAHSSVELEQGIDLSTQVAVAAAPPSPAVTFAQLGIAKGTQIGHVNLKGSASAFGAQVGAIGKVSDHWTIGLRYLSPVTFKYDDADAVFTQDSTKLVLAAGVGTIPAGTAVDALVGPSFKTGGRLTTQHATTEIKHPAQAQVGFNYTGVKDWNIEVDYAWVQWRSFKNLSVDFDSTSLNKTLIEDYNNTSSIRFGVERAFSNKATLRLGAAGASSAAPDETVTPLLPEQDRGYLTLGGSYPITSMLTLDGAYAHISTGGFRGRTDERSSRAVTALQINNGVYSLSANIFSFSLKASF
jgi:long-chain fatty acid transport protein